MVAESTAQQPGVVRVADAQPDNGDTAPAFAEEVAEQVGVAEVERAEEGGTAGAEQRVEFGRVLGREHTPQGGATPAPADWNGDLLLADVLCRVLDTDTEDMTQASLREHLRPDRFLLKAWKRGQLRTNDAK